MCGVADGEAHEAGVLWALNYLTNQYAVLADFGLEIGGGFPTGVELIVMWHSLRFGITRRELAIGEEQR